MEPLRFGAHFDEDLFAEAKQRQRREIPSYSPRIQTQKSSTDDRGEDDPTSVKFAGDAFYRRKDYHKALKKYKDCMDAVETNTVLYREMLESVARCCAQIGDRCQAIQFCAQAIAHASNFEQVTTAIELQCFIYQCFNMQSEYLYCLQKLSILHPCNYLIWVNIVKVYEDFYNNLYTTRSPVPTPLPNKDNATTSTSSITQQEEETKKLLNDIQSDVLESKLACLCVKPNSVKFELNKDFASGDHAKNISSRVDNHDCRFQNKDVENLSNETRLLALNSTQSSEGEKQQLQFSSAKKDGVFKQKCVFCCKMCSLLKLVTCLNRAWLVLLNECNFLSSFAKENNLRKQKEIKKLLDEKVKLLPEAVAKKCHLHVSKETYSNEEDIVAVGDKILLGKMVNSVEEFHRKWFSWMCANAENRT